MISLVGYKTLNILQKLRSEIQRALSIEKRLGSGIQLTLSIKQELRSKIQCALNIEQQRLPERYSVHCMEMKDFAAWYRAMSIDTLQTTICTKYREETIQRGTMCTNLEQRLHSEIQCVLI